MHSAIIDAGFAKYFASLCLHGEVSGVPLVLDATIQLLVSDKTRYKQTDSRSFACQLVAQEAPSALRFLTKSSEDEQITGLAIVIATHIGEVSDLQDTVLPDEEYDDTPTAADLSAFDMDRFDLMASASASLSNLNKSSF